MSVGTFPGMLSRKRVISSPKNPMDVSTVVSILPRKIVEIKHTISPGRFTIEPGTLDNPSLLLVGQSSWWREIDEESPFLEIPNGSIQVADSIIKDYCNGLLACNMSDAMPGLFFIPGEHTTDQIRKKHPFALPTAKAKQDKWYLALVKMADTFWARTNGNPLSISDDMRMAAEALNLKSKDWMKDFSMMEQVKCIACGSPRNPNFPICSVCKAVTDPVKARELGIEFAKF